MSPQFHETVQGRRYYEHTLPELVRQVTRLADGMERLTAILDNQKGGRDAYTHDEEEDRRRSPEEDPAPR